MRNGWAGLGWAGRAAALQGSGALPRCAVGGQGPGWLFASTQLLTRETAVCHPPLLALLAQAPATLRGTAGAWAWQSWRAAACCCPSACRPWHRWWCGRSSTTFGGGPAGACVAWHGAWRGGTAWPTAALLHLQLPRALDLGKWFMSVRSPQPRASRLPPLAQLLPPGLPCHAAVWGRTCAMRRPTCAGPLPAHTPQRR